MNIKLWFHYLREHWRNRIYQGKSLVLSYSNAFEVTIILSVPTNKLTYLKGFKCKLNTDIVRSYLRLLSLHPGGDVQQTGHGEYLIWVIVTGTG